MSFIWCLIIDNEASYIDRLPDRLIRFLRVQTMWLSLSLSWILDAQHEEEIHLHAWKKIMCYMWSRVLLSYVGKGDLFDVPSVSMHSEPWHKGHYYISVPSDDANRLQGQMKKCWSKWWGWVTCQWLLKQGWNQKFEVLWCTSSVFWRQKRNHICKYIKLEKGYYESLICYTWQNLMT